MDVAPSAELERVYRELQPADTRPYSWRTPLRPAVHRLRAWRAAAVDVRRLGPTVASSHGISVPRQLLKLWTLLRAGFTSDDFYRFRMYRLDRREASLFVPLASNITVRSELYRKLGLDFDALADKRRFGKASESLGLPVAATIADFADGQIHWWKDASLPPCDLFAKEAAAMCGAGAMTWIWDGAGQWRSEGSGFDAHGLVSRMKALSRQAPLLLQRRVKNHPRLVDLGTHGLSTVRVVTLRAPQGGSPEILLCAFRMPSGEDVADNFALGGLACAVDVDTGVLGPATRKDLRFAHIDFERHPDTGGVIAGRYLPCWQEVLGLALRAHEAFPAFPSVGWDIAIAPDGPILLEANYNWDVLLAQQAGCHPLGATDWPRHYLAWARWAEAASW